MTTLEIILLLAITALTTHVIILQRYYTERLSEHSILINYLIGSLGSDTMNNKYLDNLKLKIFDSSQ